MLPVFIYYSIFACKHKIIIVHTLIIFKFIPHNSHGTLMSVQLYNHYISINFSKLSVIDHENHTILSHIIIPGHHHCPRIHKLKKMNHEACVAWQ